jgi:hypothetical protein
MLRTLVAVVAAVSVIAGCSRPSRRSAAAPITLYDGPGVPPTWAEPGDTECEFPKEADPAGIDAADVVLRVLVRVDGSPQVVQTLEEPGFGCGPAATRCAMARLYTPATDDQGVPIAGWTPPIHVRFVR